MVLEIYEDKGFQQNSGVAIARQTLTPGSLASFDSANPALDSMVVGTNDNTDAVTFAQNPMTFGSDRV